MFRVSYKKKSEIPFLYYIYIILYYQVFQFERAFQFDEVQQLDEITLTKCQKWFGFFFLRETCILLSEFHAIEMSIENSLL